MTDTVTDFAPGDRFTYTGDPLNDGLASAIDTGATGTITRLDNYGEWYAVEFDSVKDPILSRGDWYARAVNMTKLVEPAAVVVEPEPAAPAFKLGDRFTYTGNRATDYLSRSIVEGATGTIYDTYGTGRWLVTFDRGQMVEEFADRSGWFVSESQITKLVEPEPAAVEPIDEVTWALAERDKALAELAEFKAKVASVAREYAEEHDWCTVVDDALRDMGIEPEPTTTSVRAFVYMNVDVTHAGRVPSNDDVHAAVSALDIAGFDYVDGWRSL